MSAPLPEGWSIKPARDGHRLIHSPTDLYINIVLDAVVAVEPAWAEGPEELAALCAGLCWVRDTLPTSSPQEARAILEGVVSRELDAYEQSLKGGAK